MAAKTVPWWQRITGAVRGLVAGVAALLRPAKSKPIEEPAPAIDNREEEKALTQESPSLNRDLKPESSRDVTADLPPERSSHLPSPDEPVFEPVDEPVAAQEPETTREAESAAEPDATLQALAEDEPEQNDPPQVEPEPAAPPIELVALPQAVTEPETPVAEAETPEEPALDPQPAAESEPPAEPETPIDPETPEIDAVEAAADTGAIEIAAVELLDAAANESAAEESAQAAVSEPSPESRAEEPPAVEPESSEDQARTEESAFLTESVEETVLAHEIETPTTRSEPELDLAVEAAEPLAAAEREPVVAQASDHETEAPASEEPAQEIPETHLEPAPQTLVEEQPAMNAEPQQPVPPTAAAGPAQPAAAATQAPHQAIKREDGPENSPFSVIVSQVYEGPFDLLLDLIRKQDIDIYDIPIAKITAQFLAYVNQLKAGDMDVAGEFIYTASLLIHIKSRMLLPREASGAGDTEEDPRRDLVERLLEHERFKNAAQMLQQKQMLEAASWTNPGLREFRDDADAGTEIAPEIAADTVDLVRVFREILDRARNRPIIDVEEDTVTVGQMIQFLTRRLTMEDKPVALRRLLSHTRSERALIAMFLALLELVRLQAILLRQDRQFSEIFVKKNAGFESVMNQGLARDDWQ